MICFALSFCYDNPTGRLKSVGRDVLFVEDSTAEIVVTSSEIDLNAEQRNSDENNGQIDLDKIKNYFEYDSNNREEMEMAQKDANTKPSGFDLDMQNDKNDKFGPYRIRKLHQVKAKLKEADKIKEKETNSSKVTEKKPNR